MSNPEIEMFTNGQVRILETIARGLGAKDKGESIIQFIEANRTEITPGVYRDHFTSEDIIKFIKEGM